MAILRLKNDQKTTNPPHAAQLVVGEIAINAVTGKLYTKLVDGSIVEFVGKQICFSKIPLISFDDVSDFCCYGDILNVKVSDLLEDSEYLFEIEDLTGNGVQSTVNTPVYTSYEYTPESSNTSVTLKEAIVPISINITGNKNLTILKFKIINNNTEITSRTINISCQNC
jgi:hypothetical protein